MKKEIKEIINLENFVGIIWVCLPVYLVKISLGGIPWNFLEIMILVALGWWLWEKRFSRPEWKNFLKENRKIFILINILLLSLLLATVFNNNLKTGLGIIKGWFIWPLMLTLITADLFQDKKIKVLKFFYIGAVGVAFSALLGIFLGQNTYDGRLQGIFNSPNYLAMYLAPAVIIGSILFSENKKRYALSLALIAAAVYGTYSFAAWTAIGITLSGLFLLNRKKEENKKLFMIFLVLAGVVFFLQVKTDKLSALLNLDSRSSFSSRVMVWQSAGKIMADNPIWGIGPGNFQEKYLEYQKYFPPYLEWAVPHPHNLFLAFYLYSGIAGLLTFLALIFLWLKKAFPGRKEKIVLISLGIIVYFLLHGIVDTTYFKNDLAAIFWLAFFLPL